MTEKTESRAEVVPQTMYYLGEMPYVPHYKIGFAEHAGVYVAPGGREKSESELISAGAVAVEHPLWIRSRP